MRKFRSAILAIAIAIGIAALPGIARADSLAPTGRWTAYTRGNAPLPPMGWNSWNAFGSDIDEAKVMGSAEVIVQSGLAAKGYRYIDLDDGWWLKRRLPDGRIIIRTANFPSAATADGSTSFRPFTDRLHAMGLKAGIYSDIGRNSCAQLYSTTGLNQPEGTLAEREVGLYGNVNRDIELYFAEWGFDLIKVDACGIRGLTPDSRWVSSGLFRPLGPWVDSESIGRTDIAKVRSLYDEVRQALEKHNPDNDFVFSLCLWGAANVRAWAKDMGNMSRTSDDIAPTWGRMLHSFDSSVRRPLYAHPGSWNDPDMLFIGAGDFDENHLVEARSHLSLWAMINAPLMIGYDLRKAPQEPARHLRQRGHHCAEPGPRRQSGGTGLRLQRHPDPRQDARRWRQGGSDLQSHLRPAQGHADRRPPQISRGCGRPSHRPVDRRDDRRPRRARLRTWPPSDLGFPRERQSSACERALPVRNAGAT
jgi:hypothetical protein